MKVKQNEYDEAVNWFKKHCPKGSTIYTILRKVSDSGMQREIGLVVFFPDGVLHPNYSASKLLGYTYNKAGNGVVVKDCGMDMGFHLVSQIADEVYGDYMAIRQEWL